jgi:hypothetical protein
MKIYGVAFKRVVHVLGKSSMRLKFLTVEED